jgi:hypothetical protein
MGRGRSSDPDGTLRIPDFPGFDIERPWSLSMSENFDEPFADAQQEATVMLSEPIIATYKAYFFDMPLMEAKELLHFVAHRLERQGALLAAFAASRTAAEIIDAQTAFLATALREYGNEAQAIVHRARLALPNP